MWLCNTHVLLLGLTKVFVLFIGKVNNKNIFLFIGKINNKRVGLFIGKINNKNMYLSGGLGGGEMKGKRCQVNITSYIAVPLPHTSHPLLESVESQ